jgi:lysophospholipid acyltransferase (LPLAT)-like uncharacterized protein
MQASLEQQAANPSSRAARAAERLARADAYADLSAYTFRQRFAIRIIARFAYLLVRFIGATTRFKLEGWEHWEASQRAGLQPIYACWHDRTLLSVYFWRRRGMIVMSSPSFDGECSARFQQHFGYGIVRGSSTRGGAGALVEMVKLVRAGRPAGFTVDGPRGPRYEAKTGALLLAKKTGCPVLPFAINPEYFYAASSWDRFQIPLPFTRARVRLAPPIYVAPDADETQLNAKRAELQRALDAIND